MTRTPIRTLLAPLTIALVPGLLAAVSGCKKEEPPPPLPSAAPVTTTPSLNLKPIDAGIADFDAGKKKPTGTGGGSQGLGPCCAALMQNANLAPEPTKTYMLQAAAVCQSAAAAGQGMASASGLINAALKGAGMPGACK